MNTNYTESLILKICSQPRSLDYIAHHLNGVDPITILSILKEMEDRNVIRNHDDLWLNEADSAKSVHSILSLDAFSYLKKFMGEFHFFRKPHPLDFEWRNTKESVKYLTELILQDNSKHDNILILGMPTLFANLCREDIPQKITIIERNKGIVNELRELSNSNSDVIEEDIFTVDHEQVGLFSTVVMDPPWYTPHFYQFIWLANRCMKLGGRLIISIPPINTRPRINAERIEWFQFCQQQGLCLQNLFAKRLEYSMPFFEWNAIRAAGITIGPFWRKGDVAIFEKIEFNLTSRPEYTEEARDWKEVEVNSCRVRVKIIHSDKADAINDPFEITSLIPNQILPSVSSRTPIRKKANVWTSGNRIFHTNKPEKFFSALQFFQNQIVDNSPEGREISDFIKLISECEADEYNRYLEWIYLEMERLSG